MRKAGERLEVGRFGPHRRESWGDPPGMTAQQLQQQDGRARGSGAQHNRLIQLIDRTTGEELHAVHRPIAADRKVGQQMICPGVSGVLHRRHDAHVEISGREQVVEVGRGAAHQLRRSGDQPAVDGAIDRIAVDVGNAAESHAFASAGRGSGVTTPGWRSC